LKGNRRGAPLLCYILRRVNKVATKERRRKKQFEREKRRRSKQTPHSGLFYELLKARTSN